MGTFLNGAVAIVALFFLNILFASGDFAEVQHMAWAYPWTS